MQINVAQQLKSSIGVVRGYELSGSVDIDDSPAVVAGEVRLVRTDRGILVQGRLHTELEIECSRCLSLFNCPLTLNIEEEYFPTTDVDSGGQVSLPDEPGHFTIDEHNILDLTEAVRQYALLAMPMKPLCREDCAGLCHHCGYNLNLGPCDCPTEEVDLRWAALTKLAGEWKGTE